MTGYWHDEEATYKAIRDGWLHTGDIGELDADGHPKTTDAQHDILVSSGGDNVPPARVQGLLTLRRDTQQPRVFGDTPPHLVPHPQPDDADVAHRPPSPANPPAA